MQLLSKGNTRLGIQSGKGFVHQHDFGVGGEGPRYGYPLSHTPRQLVRVFILKSV